MTAADGEGGDLERAIEAYRRGDAGLWKAARRAGVPLRSFMDELGQRGIPVPVDYTLDDAEEDVEQATGGG